MRRVIFICPDIDKPSGGIKQIYRQVDILNKNGYESFVMHENNGFKCNWFDNETPVLYNKSVFKQLSALIEDNKSLRTKVKAFYKRIKGIKLIKQKDEAVTNKDILVFPEIFGPKMLQVMEGIPKVIYNQGCYQTFFGYDIDLKNHTTAYKHPDLIGVIVNSEDGRRYMQYAFPHLKIYRVHYGFDSAKFELSEEKKQQICLMPRRLKVDIVQVINILKFRGALKSWDIRLIDNMSEEQVATCMKESAIFLSFNINEGFGMPPAEAMACGCVVVGYTGKGGTEIFKNEFSYPVIDRDVQSFAKVLEEVLRNYEADPRSFNEKGREASKFILSEYSLEVEEEDIVNAWNLLLK